jgi:hypothetical protein
MLLWISTTTQRNLVRNSKRTSETFFTGKARESMSQQMHFDEEQRGYQAAYTPTLGENSVSYNQRIAEVQVQKVGSLYGKKSPSPWQRMVVAIFSLFVLLGGMGFLTSNDVSSFGVLVVRLVGLIVVCITVAIINYNINAGDRH